MKGYSDVAEAELIVKKSVKFDELQFPKSTTEKIQTTSSMKTTRSTKFVKPKEIKSTSDTMKINSQDRSFK